MFPQLSCAFAPNKDTPAHSVIAETLGYQRVWLYDSPSLYGDVWMTLARCGDRTHRIGLGPSVLVPSLRHPIISATCTSLLADIVGADRVALALGTGFSARRALGQPPMKWSQVAAYVTCLRTLLRGGVAEWEGKKIQMLQAEGYGALRPLEVPVLLGIGGPLGAETAATIADGAFLVGSRPFPGFSWQASLFMGTVLRDDETYSSPRVMNAAGHAAAARYHYASENGKSLDRLPNAEPWEAAYAAVDSEVRHLEMQRGHLVAVNDRDRPFISDQSIQVTGAAFDQVELRDRMAALFASGVTEVAYQPAGDDIPGELDAFASALS